MSRSKTNRDEPGVAEVRRWRTKLWKQGGGTIKGVMKLLRANESKRIAASRTARQRKSA